MAAITPQQGQYGRTYQWGEQSFYSVTTILGALAKPALPNWAAKTSAEYVSEHWKEIMHLCLDGRQDEVVALVKGAPWRQRDKAANLGTDVHHAIDLFLSDGAVLEDYPHMAPFHAWLEKAGLKILEHEVTVFSENYNYAGTLDLLCENDQGIGLIDFKTGKGIYPEYALQVAAYARADFIGRRDGSTSKMPHVDWCACLHLRPDFAAIHKVRDIDISFTSFLYLREVFRWQNEMASNAFDGVIR